MVRDTTVVHLKEGKRTIRLRASVSRDDWKAQHSDSGFSPRACMGPDVLENPLPERSPKVPNDVNDPLHLKISTEIGWTS